MQVSVFYAWMRQNFKKLNLNHHDINMYEGIGQPGLAHWTLLTAPLILSNWYEAHILTHSDIKPEKREIIWWKWAYGIENVELNLVARDRRLVNHYPIEYFTQNTNISCMSAIISQIALCKHPQFALRISIKHSVPQLKMAFCWDYLTSQGIWDFCLITRTDTRF